MTSSENVDVVRLFFDIGDRRAEGDIDFPGSGMTLARLAGRDRGFHGPLGLLPGSPGRFGAG